MKTLHCSDAGFNCEAVIKATTTGEVLAQAAVHAKEVHGVQASPELAQKLEMLIRDEK